MSREKDIFLEAMERSSVEEREAFVRSACGPDAAMLERVRCLLQAHEQAGNFLKGEGNGPAAQSTSGAGSPLAEGPGTVIGRYKLLQKIGEGGFGVVYMAEQREPVKRKVALKIIKLGMDTKQVVGRFEAERQALAMMEHPNIARVLDAGATETGRPYFVMELVRGVPITQFCDENHLTPEQRLRLFMQVCEALQHAHQKGIIHRDIKPTNVLVTMHDDKAVPKVIDFGIAKAIGQDLTDKTLFTRYHEFLGTPAYMSPEQTQLSGLDIDTRSDIYSLGVLLYELLTGRTPFDAKELLSASVEELRRRIREDEPLKPSTRLNTLAEEDRARIAKLRKSDVQQLRRTLKGDLDWIVMKALEKDRARRYESASAFAQDVLRYLKNEPVNAVAPSVGYRFRKFARRHRAALTTALGVFAFLLAGTAVSTWLALRAVKAEKAARLLLINEQQARQQLETLRARADQEAARARTEAATAEAVTRFLNEDLFASADPEHEPDREITLRTVLDRASQQLQTSLAQQPLVAAAIHTTIGEAYQNLSLYAQAEEHLRLAHQLYERERGERHEDTLRALIDFAGALSRKGQSGEAQPLAERAHALAREEFGAKHPLTIKCATELAWIYYRTQKTAEAYQLAEDAYASAQGASGVNDGDLMSAMYLVGRHRGRSQGGEFEAGEKILKQALQLTREQRGENHVRTVWVKNGLAAYYYDHAKKSDEAEALFLDALRTRQQLLGESHASTLITHINLGLLYQHRLNRPTQAIFHYVKVLEYRPAEKRALEPLPGLFEKAPLKPLAAQGNTAAWRVTTNSPPAAWLNAGFEDSGWRPSTQPNAAEAWFRHEFDLASLPGEPCLFKIQGSGGFEVFVNGVPAVQMGKFGSAPRKFQLAVGSQASIKALRAGRNVIAIHGINLRPTEELHMAVHPFPELNLKLN